MLEIKIFEITTKEFTLNQTIEIQWEVVNANKVELENYGEIPSKGKKYFNYNDSFRNQYKKLKLQAYDNDSVAQKVLTIVKKGNNFLVLENLKDEMPNKSDEPEVIEEQDSNEDDSNTMIHDEEINDIIIEPNSISGTSGVDKYDMLNSKESKGLTGTKYSLYANNYIGLVICSILSITGITIVICAADDWIQLDHKFYFTYYTFFILANLFYVNKRIKYKSVKKSKLINCVSLLPFIMPYIVGIILILSFSLLRLVSIEISEDSFTYNLVDKLFLIFPPSFADGYLRVINLIALAYAILTRFIFLRPSSVLLNIENKNVIICRSCKVSATKNEERICTNCKSNNWTNQKKRTKTKATLSVLLILMALFYSSPFLEREYLLNFKRQDITEKDYDWALLIKKNGGLVSNKLGLSKVLPLRANSRSLDYFIDSYREDKVEKLLQSDKYFDALDFIEESWLYKESPIARLLYRYESKNFDKLSNKLLIKKFKWSYQLNSTYFPASYETKFEKGFFGDYQLKTYKYGDYTKTKYTGAYLFIEIKNNFKTLALIGDIKISAKEKITTGDYLSGGFNALGKGLLSAVISESFGGSSLQNDAAFLGGVASGANKYWNGKRNEYLENILIYPGQQITRRGKMYLRERKFDSDGEPRISKENWEINEIIYVEY